MTNTRPALPASIVFDLDGTLVDSAPDILRAMNLLLSELGRRPAALDELRGWVADGGLRLVQRGLSATGGMQDLNPVDLAHRFMAHYAESPVVDSRLYPGVATTLRTLKASGHCLGVCTNKATDLAIEVLARLDIGPLFSAVVGGDSVPARKPHPAHLLATLATMSHDGGKALMVGDSENDVAAARAAGVPVVAVAYGYAHKPPAELGADVVIEDFAALPEAAAAFL